MQYMNCLMNTVILVGDCYLLMPLMLLILRTGWLHCGMLEYFGTVTLDFCFNTYLGYTSLLLQDGSEGLLSREGIAQGDPLSMMLYAVAVLPLIHSLRAPGKWTQNWYTDDSSCVADLPSLQTWFEELLHRGPDYDYYPEPSKTVPVVGPADVQQASKLFTDLRIRIVPGE